MYEWQAIIKSSGRPQCVRRGVRGNPAALTDVEAEPNGTNRLFYLPPEPSLPFFPSFDVLILLSLFFFSIRSTDRLAAPVSSRETNLET